ncbi:MAG: hypothetical protein P4L53_04390 [Candidatus Obscuribacterales bacterium]|nr:hypothetical protein [Candidatus Obscuribacterales bacterium]
MDTRKLALAAGGLFLSLLCTQSMPASADEQIAPSFSMPHTPALLLNPNSGQLSDLRHFSKDGMNTLYDEICLANHNTRVIFWQKNKQRLVLEYFPAPVVTLPNGQKTEQRCPTISELAPQIASDSQGQFRFEKDLTLSASPSSTGYLFAPVVDAKASPLHARIYLSPEGKFTTEEVLDEAHNAVKFAHRRDDGGYEETSFFADKTISHHRITDKLGVVTAEEVYAPGGQPLVTTLSNKDGILTTKFDPVNHKVSYRDNHLSDGKESTREVFYPGTDKLRYKATYTGSATAATFYRLDGTIERLETLSPYNLTMRYMDTTGLVPLYEQSWTYDNAKGKATNIVMHSMSELDAKGEEVREFTVSDDHTYIKQRAERKVTKGDMTYPSVFYNYRADGTLEEERWITPGSLPNPPAIPHTAAENIKLVVDKDKLKHQPFESLPVPAQINMSFDF